MKSELRTIFQCPYCDGPGEIAVDLAAAASLPHGTYTQFLLGDAHEPPLLICAPDEEVHMPCQHMVSGYLDGVLLPPEPADMSQRIAEFTMNFDLPCLASSVGDGTLGSTLWDMEGELIDVHHSPRSEYDFVRIMWRRNLRHLQRRLEIMGTLVIVAEPERFLAELRARDEALSVAAATVLRTKPPHGSTSLSSFRTSTLTC